MILGNDIAGFQGNIDWNAYKNNTNFVIMKTSEGTSFIDPWFGNNRMHARNANLPCGFYHFARPDLGNTPEGEAKFFCALVDGDPIQEGEVLVLDFEVGYDNPVQWCKAWLDYVSKHFDGMKPLIYLNQNLVSSYDWTPLVEAGYGLWIAAYTYDPNNNNFEMGAWKFAAMQQWTNQQQVPGIVGNVDGNVFFGDKYAFRSYGYKKPAPLQIPATIPSVTPPPVVPPVETPVETPVIPPVNESSVTPPIVEPPLAEPDKNAGGSGVPSFVITPGFWELFKTVGHDLKLLLQWFWQ